MTLKLKDKVAVITGASKEIGAGIAKAYALAGAKVVLNYAKDQASAEKVAVFLASDNAAWVTGERIQVSGGQL